MASMMGGLGAEAYDRQYNDSDLIRRIVSYFNKFRRKVIIIIVSLVGMAILSAIPPLIIAESIQTIDTASPQDVIRLIIAIFGAGIAVWGANWVRRLLTSQVIADLVLTMRKDAFAASVRQDMAFYDRFSSGRIVSRITSDTDQFGQIVVMALDVIQQLTASFILIFILFQREWHLTLAVLVMVPFVAWASMAFRRIARQVTRQSSRVMAEVNKSIQEAVTGIGVAKNFRQEQAIYGQFLEVSRQSYEVNLKRGFVLGTIFPVLSVLSGFGTALLVYLGGQAVLASTISLASWYLFVVTVDRFWFPVMNLASFWSQFQQGLSASERVFALIDAESSVVQTGAATPMEMAGEIVFDDVMFGYTAATPILSHFNFTIQPGERIAFVGHTGAGKSSIIKLIARFYEFQGGQIRIDGEDIRSFNLPAYRSKLGIVSQVPFLFNGTVAENIAFGSTDATPEAIEAVANLVGDGEWLETLPDGLKSEVGERGHRLSMGQRQLVAISRILLKSPSIFILDEATANIDPFTESQIQDALELAMAGRTSIVIAHRLSTVRSADRIVVLADGAIIEEGNHEQLLTSGGHYAELYETYFRHQSLEYIDKRGWQDD